MNIRSFWHRGVNRIYTEAVQRWNEKEFTAQDGQTLRYMFFPCKKSDILRSEERRVGKAERMRREPTFDQG